MSNICNRMLTASLEKSDLKYIDYEDFDLNASVAPMLYPSKPQKLRTWVRYMNIYHNSFERRRFGDNADSWRFTS